MWGTPMFTADTTWHISATNEQKYHETIMRKVKGRPNESSNFFVHPLDSSCSSSRRVLEGGGGTWAEAREQRSASKVLAMVNPGSTARPPEKLQPRQARNSCRYGETRMSWPPTLMFTFAVVYNKLTTFDFRLTFDVPSRKNVGVGIVQMQNVSTM